MNFITVFTVLVVIIPLLFVGISIYGVRQSLGKKTVVILITLIVLAIAVFLYAVAISLE
jgi:hypothetical protein